VLKQLNAEQVKVVCVVKPPEKPDGLEYEMDEMWRSYFGKKITHVGCRQAIIRAEKF